MLKAVRESEIYEIVQREQQGSIPDLAKRLGVSSFSIRRDLIKLESQGLIERVRGGARPITQSNVVPLRRIGAVDASPFVDVVPVGVVDQIIELVQGAGVIILDDSPVTIEVARRLPQSGQRAIVVTNSLTIATTLKDHQRVDVQLIGGRLRENATLPILTAEIEALNGMAKGICVFGSCAVHPKAGVTVPSPEDARLKRAMAYGAAEVVAAGSAKSLGVEAAHLIMPINGLSRLIVGGEVTDDLVATYEARNIKVTRG